MGSMSWNFFVSHDVEFPSHRVSSYHLTLALEGAV